MLNNFSGGFDTGYSVQDSLDVNSSTSNYAAVPTSDTMIHVGSSNDETRPYFFAACVDSDMPNGVYQAEVVWTAYAVDAPIESGNVIVDIDPGMIPVRWNYAQCTYGNGYGNVMDSAPTTNLAATNPLTTSCWVKADPSIFGTGTNADWYNYTTDNTATRDAFDQPYYTQRKMANAVTFTSTASLATYQAAAVGTPIPDSAIGAYWTYVPRFAYRVENFNYSATNYPKAFDVRLTNANMAYNSVADIDISLDPAIYPQYLVPPGFDWPNGDGTVTPLNGIWFGKFATTGTATNPTVKPIVSMLDNQDIVSRFQSGLLFGSPNLMGGGVSFNGANQHNFAGYAINSASATVNSHMAKMSEWGIMVYFTKSLYGVCSNMNCTSDNLPLTDTVTTPETERVRNNARIPNTTGCGPNSLDPTDDAMALTSCSLYNTQLGVLASTQHNIYGIYDLAGGVWEYVLGNYVTGNGSAVNAYIPTNSNGGFANLPAMFNAGATVYSPYFDVFPAPPLTNLGSDIAGGMYGTGSGVLVANDYWRVYPGKLGLGQAIFETVRWSGASGSSVSATNSWFVRGSQPGNTISVRVEAVSAISGTPRVGDGFRTILTITP